MPLKSPSCLALACVLLATACGSSPLDPTDRRTAEADHRTPRRDGFPPEGEATPGPTGAPTSSLVVATCTDGKYSETLPNIDADVSDLVARYDASTAEDVVLRALDRRYPLGAKLMREGKSKSFCAGFLRAKTDAATHLLDLSTGVHECGHLVNFGDGKDTKTERYILTAERTLACPTPGRTFARSRIRKDAHQAKRPACGSNSSKCDFYADTYLDGDPDNSTFEGGDQSFHVLFEEVVQYVNSLAVGYAFNDQNAKGMRSSERDGILTMLWYMERYLQMARTSYSADYERIVGDACWQDAILSVWGRAALYLEKTRELRPLGIEADAIEGLVMDPALLDEIHRVRKRTGCVE